MMRVDFMFNTYMRENIVRNTINEYCNFVRDFIFPKAYEEVALENIYGVV